MKDTTSFSLGLTKLKVQWDVSRSLINHQMSDNQYLISHISETFIFYDQSRFDKIPAKHNFPWPYRIRDPGNSSSGINRGPYSSIICQTIATNKIFFFFIISLDLTVSDKNTNIIFPWPYRIQCPVYTSC